MRDDATLLLDIHNAIEIVGRYTPADRTTLDTDLPIQSLLIRYLQIIGEASWRLSDAFKLAHPQLPWARIAAMRHVLVHDYFRVDLNQVWNVATVHVPVLKPQIDAILALLPPTPFIADE
ncbi:MAG TPA: HepT-like ribonuclease domain-containing protein [Tepidisphaeraceae bacterium]|nr:HepT-like ribonuclease domain-containing protein [Tepidisphaeraceae bacterium]